MKTKTVRTLFALLTAVSLLLCAAFGTAESTTDWPEQPKATPLTAEEAETLIRLALGMDPSGKKDITWITAQIPQYMQNPEQYKQDLWDGIFGTWADGISLAGDPKDDGRVVFVMELPAPVAMPDAYSVSYARKGEDGQEITTTLERDADGNIHYIDGDTELVYVRTEGKYRRYAVTAGGFGKVPLRPPDIIPRVRDEAVLVVREIHVTAVTLAQTGEVILLSVVVYRVEV